MELGGKSPAVVFADADLEAAIDSTLFGVFSLNGERCTAGSAAFSCERPIYEEFRRALTLPERGQHRGGRPARSPATEVGALVHPEHYDEGHELRRDRQRTEGRLLAGGGRPEHLPER